MKNERNSSERLTQKLNDHDWRKEDIGAVLEGSIGLSADIGDLNRMVREWTFSGSVIDWEDFRNKLIDICTEIVMLCVAVGYDPEKVWEEGKDE